MIRVLIADDHAIVRHGLKQIIEDSGEMRVVAEAASGIEALPWPDWVEMLRVFLPACTIFVPVSACCRWLVSATE